MTFQEILKMYVEEGYIGTDNTCNGKCTKCGECCGTILPLDQEDVNKIAKFVYENNISTNRYMLVMRQKMQCPYYNGDKEKGCSIYEARPKICRFYKCDRKLMSSNEYQEMSKAVAIDMWALATDIEKEMKKENESNKKARKTIS